jgi:rod shape determining protein RodA
VKITRSLDLSSFFKVTTRERFDWITPVCLLLLCTFGVFFIYSAQLASGREQWAQQIVWIGAGAVLYVAVSLLDYRLWLR